MPADDNAQPPNRLVRAVADAAVALTGARLGGAPGAAIAAGVTPYAEELLRKALAEFKPDVQQRVTQMLDSTAKASECDPDKLAELIGGSQHTRLITVEAMAAAAGTAWPPKVYALGKALADGLIATDDAKVNVADLVIPAMADMERPHLSLLELLVRWIPVETVGQPISVRSAEGIPPRTSGVAWYIGGYTWTARQIGEIRPALRPVLTSLIGTLQRHGLAAQNDDTAAVLAKYSEAIQKESSRKALRAGQRITSSALIPPAISKLDTESFTPPPSWSATELGEQVLGYYELAAEEFGHYPDLATQRGIAPRTEFR